MECGVTYLPVDITTYHKRKWSPFSPTQSMVQSLLPGYDLIVILEAVYIRLDHSHWNTQLHTNAQIGQPNSVSATVTTNNTKCKYWMTLLSIDSTRWCVQPRHPSYLWHAGLLLEREVCRGIEVHEILHNQIDSVGVGRREWREAVGEVDWGNNARKMGREERRAVPSNLFHYPWWWGCITSMEKGPANALHWDYNVSAENIVSNVIPKTNEAR